MNASLLELESFDDGSVPAVPQSADYKRGFEDGKAATENSVATLQARALTNLAGSIDDMAFGYEDARQHVIAKVSPLMAQVAELIVPNTLKATFVLHLRDAMTSAFDDASKDAVKIAVSPDSFEAVLAADLGVAKPFEVTADPKLVSGQAHLEQGGTSVMIDLASLIEDLQVALRGLEQPERTHANG